MRKGFWVKGAGLAVAIGALAAVAGCDTSYYGDSGTTTTSRTTTTTTAPAPMPPSASSSSTTIVTPNPDGSVTTTERTQRNY
jgi:hypothetical protein